LILGYSTGSVLLLYMLFNWLGNFARLISDSQPFWADPGCCTNSYKKEMQWDSISITPLSFEPRTCNIRF